jgi:hypothetical protein
MAKMTPEQEAQSALDFGVARIGLAQDAQLAYDRLAERRARAQVPALITALSFPMGPGLVVVLLPWLITRWQPGAPYPIAVRAVGGALIAAGGVAFVPAIIGQALLLSRPVLLSYAAVLLIALAAFVRFYEERTLAKRFGADFEAYRKQVPGWWPRLPHQATARRRT